MQYNVIIGYSGHAYVVLESALSIGLAFGGYCDTEEKPDNPYNLKYLGLESVSILQNRNWFVGIGDIQMKKKVFEKFRGIGECLIIYDITSSVSSSAMIGAGTFIGSQACVNARVMIGECVIINSASVVEHECVIGDYSHIAPGAILAGNVTIGAESFIGANAVIKEGTHIGSDVTVGAGTVVLSDIPDGSIVVGNPGRIIKTRT